jgi:methylase of polypeptide subunit release factors
MNLYRQPEKGVVRKRVLSHAVRVLTTQRMQSVIVQPQELRAVVHYGLKTLKKMGRSDLRPGVNELLETWLTWQADCIQAKRPSDLKVIYLCGPEPLNDLSVLLRLGVNPHNVWGVESNEAAYQLALAQIAKSGIPVKLHKGTLSSFFERVQETFDIAYLDTTGPVLGGSPLALAPTLEVFRASRLAPLSVLITNFAEVPKPDAQRYTGVFTDYFRFRYHDMPRAVGNKVDPAVTPFEAEYMAKVVKKNLRSVYSEFITRLIIDLGRYWIPSARGFCILQRQYMSEVKLAQSVEQAAYSMGKQEGTFEALVASLGDTLLSPGAYPLISFLRAMEQRNASEPLIQHLGGMQFFGKTAVELNRVVALLDKIVEGHWKIASEELLRAIAFPWFDYDGSSGAFSCDLPFPNLLVHSLLGVYGRPYFYSSRDSIRGRYTAKATEMFTDLYVLDQCRYYFDWLPTVHQLPDRFKSHAFQVLARCIMDRIWSSDCSPDTHPFRGSSVAGFHELKGALFHSLPARRNWSNSSKKNPRRVRPVKRKR